MYSDGLADGLGMALPVLKVGYLILWHRCALPFLASCRFLKLHTPCDVVSAISKPSILKT